MGNTVSATFKPSGGFIPSQPTAPDPLESALRSAFDQGEPCDADGNPIVEQPAEDRTITYPLRGGGFLVEECPAWCIKDHADEIEHGIYAADLTHEGEEVSLSFTTTESERDVVLAARITQWPHSDDGAQVPYMALLPVADNGETLGYLTPSQVEAHIRKVEQHLQALRRMNERLAAARVENQRANGRSWRSLTAGDIEGMPIPALLQAFGLRVIEVGEMPHKVQGFLDRTGEKPAVYLLRSLPQADRDRTVRQLLAAFIEGQA